MFLSRAAGRERARLRDRRVLILVGAAMFKSVSELSYERIEDALPAFLTIILIPLTFSITQGILWALSRTSAST